MPTVVGVSNRTIEVVKGFNVVAALYTGKITTYTTGIPVQVYLYYR